MQWWIDGTLIGSYSDVQFGGASDAKMWDGVAWRPVWGGQGSMLQQEQYMYIDDYYVSGK